MDKRIVLIHRILFFIGIAVLAGSLVFYLIRWNKLPDMIGVHFRGDGSFDVTESKFYGFYPHIIGSIIIAGIAAAAAVISRKKTGLRISDRGEELFRAELLITLDFFMLYWCMLFALWSRSVSLQQPMPVDLVQTISGIIGIIIAAGIIAQILTCIIFRNKDSSQKTDLPHRLCRLIAWLLTGSTLLILLEIWDRYPGDEELYMNPDYYGLAYFANFDAYLDKHLLLIPIILAVLIIAVTEVISVRAAKSGNAALSAYTDRIKLLCGMFFFYWNFLLMCENGIGIVSVGIFALLCAVFTVMYIRKCRTALKS